MVNNVVLVGRITRDIEITMSNSGTEICRFTLAVNRNRKNASGGYDADFINCVTFGQSARFMSQFIRKGYQIAVTGRIETSQYDNQQGQRVFSTTVVADSVNNLEPRRDNSGFGNDPYSQPANNPYQQPNTYTQPVNNDNVTTFSPNPFDNTNQNNNGSSPSTTITDDDLPF